MKWLVAVVLALAVSGAGYFALLHEPGRGDLGPAAPQAAAGPVDFDGVLADGDLIQGPTTLKVPRGINVALRIDGDVADTLPIECYDITFALAAGSIEVVNAHSYRKGLFTIRLKSDQHSLGTLAGMASHQAPRRRMAPMHYQLRNADGSHSVWQPQKIVCVAKNYAEHAAEMRSQVPDQPVFFLKPNTSLCDLAGPLVLPQGRGVVHHEIELGLVIGKRLSRADRIPQDAVAGYVLAIDLTLRELQGRLREKGYPWDASKAFAGACPVSAVFGADLVPDPAAADLGITVNGEPRQDGNSRDMVFKIPRLLAEAADIFILEPGDLVLTGTPVGVGPLAPGDRYEAWLNGQRFAGEVAGV